MDGELTINKTKCFWADKGWADEAQEEESSEHYKFALRELLVHLSL